MILDRRLKLVDNLPIGTKTFGNVWVSPDKISVANLRSFGDGTQIYCSVTIKTAFKDANTSVAFALLSENLYTKEQIESFAATPASLTSLYLQPYAGFSGFISSAASDGNFQVGKIYTFPVNPFTAKETVLGSKHFSSKNYYFALFEIDPTTGLGTTSVNAGAIDVDIVTIATPGAGVGFCDLDFYPTSVKVS